MKKINPNNVRAWDSRLKKYFRDPLQVLECLRQQITGMYNHEAEGMVFERSLGREDKLQNEIFEGDICRCFDDPEDSCLAVVVWDKDLCGYVFLLEGGDVLCYTDIEPEILIIGNINENPELIKDSLWEKEHGLVHGRKA